MYSFTRHRCRYRRKIPRTVVSSSDAPDSSDRQFQPVVDEVDHTITNDISDDVNDEEIIDGKDTNMESKEEKQEKSLPGYMQELIEDFETLKAQHDSTLLGRIVDNICAADRNTFLIKTELSKVLSTFNSLEQSKESVMQERGFNKVFLSVSSQDGTSYHMYVKNIVSVLQKQVELAKVGDFTFRPSRRDASELMEHPLHSDWFNSLYNWRKSLVQRSKNEDIFWTEDGMLRSFIGFIQLFSDKTAASLKANAFVAYPFHAVFLNVSAQYRRFLIGHGYTIVAFLPTTLSLDDVSYFKNLESEAFQTDEHSNELTVVELEDYVKLSSRPDGRKEKMQILHESIGIACKPLTEISEHGLLCHSEKLGKWQCYPLICSYCCDIIEAKDLACIRHNITPRRPCIRCISTNEDMRNNVVKPYRTFQHMSEVRRKIKESIESYRSASSLPRTQQKQCSSILRMGDELLREWSLAPWKSILEYFREQFPWFIVPDLYSLFTFEELHNLDLGISKLLKICFVLYLSSGELKDVTFNGTVKKRSLSSLKTLLLRACNSYLSFINDTHSLPDLNVDFSRKDSSLQLNGLFLHSGVRGMLEGKDYRNVDKVFPFVMAFVDRVLGHTTSCPLTNIAVLYSEIRLVHLHQYAHAGCSAKDISILKQKIDSLKECTIQLFKDHCDHGLFTLKFHLLSHLVNDLERFSSLDFLSASPYEQFNRLIKQSYWNTSRRYDTVMDETVSNLDNVLQSVKDRRSATTNLSTIPSSFPKSGVSVTLSQLKAFSNYSIAKLQVCNPQLSNMVKHLTKDSLHKLVELIESELQQNNINALQAAIDINFVKSGFIAGSEPPSFDLYDSNQNMVKYDDTLLKQQVKQRVFADNSFGPSKKEKHSFVFMKGGSEEQEEFWFAQAMLLFTLSVSNTTFTQDLVFVQYMTVTSPKDGVDQSLRCICLRWETEDGIDHSLDSMRNVQKDSLFAGEWYGLVPFHSICGTCHILRSNVAIQPFTEQLPWTHHRFYVNRFFHH